MRELVKGIKIKKNILYLRIEIWKDENILVYM